MQGDIQAVFDEGYALQSRQGILPPMPTLVVGRDQALRRLRDQLGIGGRVRGSLYIQVLTAVHGWPGVGKTTMAAVLAHDPEVSASFPDGVLWTSLGQKPDLLSELAKWGLALGSEDLMRAKSIKDARDRLTALLRDRRMLLIVDDVWETEHAITFKVGGRRCAMLVTTRHLIVAEALAPTADNIYKLDILSDEDALELLAKLAPTVVEQHRRECHEVVQEVEGLPLALQVVGRLLNVEASRGWGIKDLLRELRSDVARLLRTAAPPELSDLLSQTTPTVAALLGKSTERLNTQTRARFALLGAFAPKPASFGAEAMAGVWDVELSEAKRTIDELIDRGLLESLGSKRFWMHALLVAHAKSLLRD